MEGEHAQVAAQEDGAAPDHKRKRVEAAPDIPLTVSAIPAVQEAARRNNAETRPRKRMRKVEFLNDTFRVLGTGAVEDKALIEDTLALMAEMVTLHQVLPRNTSLSKVLYAWMDAGYAIEGVALLKSALQLRESVPSDVAAGSFDEKVATVALRVVTAPSVVGLGGISAAEVRDLIEQLIALVPAGSLKRRVLSPLLAYARVRGEWDFSCRIVAIAEENDIELWDADYNELLRTIDEAADGTGDAEKQVRLESVLTVMSAHHPVVGAENAKLIHRIAGGAIGCTISDGTGVCSHCGQTLSSFDLSDTDRAVLLDDIEEKLIRPRVEGLSRYEPEKRVTEEEKERRWKEYEEFKRVLASMNYDAVIDGANVGYYGLNSWYAEAKHADLMEAWRQEQAATGGNDTPPPRPVTTHPPFPVDVSPKFQLIESMRKAVERNGKKPLIVLHSRHLAKGPAENMKLLETWRAGGSVIPSPAFLNDDYTWLYAAIVRPDTFIASNDQMRDHHFLMLSPRFFIRWRQRHRITYKAFYSSATRSVTLNVRMPCCYAVWVQKAVSSAGRHHWHVPFMSSIAVIDQATNRTTTTDADVDLAKDGDDNCSAWVCTLKN